MDDLSPDMRAEAALALGLLGDEASVGRRSALIDDPDPDVAEHAATSLGRSATPAARRRLELALNDARLGVRIAAISALVEGGRRDAVGPLLERLARLDDRDEYEQDGIVIALGKIADPRAEAPLLALLTARHATLRYGGNAPRHGDVVADALDAIGSPTARAASDGWRRRQG